MVGALVEDHQHHNAPQSNNAPNSNNAPHSNNAKTQQEEYQIAVALVNNILADQDRGDKEDGDDRIDGQNGEDRGQVTDEGSNVLLASTKLSPRVLLPRLKIVLEKCI